MKNTKVYFKSSINDNGYYDIYNVTDIKEVYYFNKETKVYITARELEIESIGYLVSFFESIEYLYYSIAEFGLILDKTDYIGLILNSINTQDLIKLNKWYELKWFMDNEKNILCLTEDNNRAKSTLENKFSQKPFIRDSSSN